MIGCFPSIYPDELLYSLLARYYVRSGYMAYTFAAQDLYVNKTVKPDIEFVNRFTGEAFNMITKCKPIEEIVEKHTMFPYYGRFLNHDRRERAFDSLVSMNGNYHNLLAVPKTKDGTGRYLRYCPLCVKDDREQYGETYWHRNHQMTGVNVCPKHKCCLISSDVIISGKASPSLKSAEEVVKDLDKIIFPDDDIEALIAGYVDDVFQSPVDMLSKIRIGEYLHSKMANTKYRSVRGEQRNIALLHSDFIKYYEKLRNNWFTELWQIQKALTSDRVNTFEICLLAMFLDIPVGELVKMKPPEKGQEQLFDEQIKLLHEQGLKYPEIAERLNASYSLVKSIGENLYGTYHRKKPQHKKPGAKTRDWSDMDNNTLPLVKNIIKELQGDGYTRPKKVTVFAVEKRLGLASKQLSNLPKCRSEIEKHYECQEQYWAREAVWAANTVIYSGKPFNWKHIRELTNMRKDNLKACLPYLHEFCDGALRKRIEDLL
ncbi:MAG: TniQ family protein [bacterium]|nr:TniQ family protein [bacterium]